ncbi:SRD5A1 [Scenedesmus sp. PABB004]|nr:SRD5A1 [Scenedesmus sp. PABB004]
MIAAQPLDDAQRMSLEVLTNTLGVPLGTAKTMVFRKRALLGLTPDELLDRVRTVADVVGVTTDQAIEMVTIQPGLLFDTQKNAEALAAGIRAICYELQAPKAEVVTLITRHQSVLHGRQMHLSVADIAHLAMLRQPTGRIAESSSSSTLRARAGARAAGSVAPGDSGDRRRGSAQYSPAAAPRSRLWGPSLNGRLAWATQELPSLLAPLALMAARPEAAAGLAPLTPRGAVACAFALHYAHRALVYPLLMRAPKPTAVTVWALAALFCAANGLTQAAHVLSMPDDARWAPRHVVGLGLWAAGWLANLRADATLRALRPRGGGGGGGGGGYGVPRGGLFELVTAANYLAESVEWAGWALAACTARPGGLAPAAFAVATVANLAPRARSHHAWLRARIPAYPRDRRAFIPYLW